MGIRKPFELGEWYHCYSRGVDKRRTFQTKVDYQRFLQALYLSNSIDSTRRSDFLRATHDEVLAKSRLSSPLVSIGAYCIMPNHFHLLVQEITEGGIVRFMQKIGTAYTMYFNIKNERVGGLFVGPFRSRHVDSERYLRHVAQYIHLNPAELYEREWKSGMVGDIRSLEKKLREYPFSSLQDYCGSRRAERVILDQEAFALLEDGMPTLKESVVDAAEYYKELR